MLVANKADNQRKVFEAVQLVLFSYLSTHITAVLQVRQGPNLHIVRAAV